MDEDKSFQELLDFENDLAFRMALQRYSEEYPSSSDDDSTSEDSFSLEEAERFSRFYSSLRDGIQDASLYRHESPKKSRLQRDTEKQ